MRNNDESSRTDVAALSAGAVAVVLAMFVESSAYDILGVIVSITIAVLMLSYVGGRRRGGVQQTAVIAVVGLSLMPIIGFGWELFLAAEECPSEGIPAFLDCSASAEESRVEQWAYVIMWPVCLAMAGFLAPRRFWRHSGD